MPKPKVKRGLAVPPPQPGRTGATAKRRRAPNSGHEEGVKRTAKRHQAAAGEPAGKVGDDRGGADTADWRCASVIDRQASAAVARLCQAAETQRGGATIKALTLAPHVVHKKATHAVTCQTLLYLPLLQSLLDESGLRQRHPRLPAPAAWVLLYEALLGQGLAPAGPAERAVLAARPQLRAALVARMEAAGAKAPADLLPQREQPARPHPRTARVNTLKTSVAAALAELHARPATSAARVDPHLPDVLMLPPGTDLHDHPLVAAGSLVLQSKASCMPAHALAPRPGWTVVDCCAAPGNKTTHVAAMVGPAGRVLAFDRDARRLARLRGNVAQAGAGGIVTATCADFLSLDPGDPAYAQVRGVILDPSCSGSGTTVSRMDHLLPLAAGQAAGAGAAAGGGLDGDGGDDGGADARVEQLARFQEAALRHALAFPALERLAYSTCSVHLRENEQVVAAVLPEAQARGFALERALPAWPRRGLPGLVPSAELLVRTDAAEDGTDGFFVAVFARAKRGKGRQAEEGGAGSSDAGRVAGAAGSPARPAAAAAPPNKRAKHKKARAAAV